MSRFWKKREDRADWPEPRAEFLQSLADEIRGTRGRVRSLGLRLAFVMVIALALLVPLSAFAGGPGSSARDAVKSVVSVVQADSKSSTSRNNGGKHDDDDDNGKKHDDDDDDDDDDDNGDYDYDKKCPNKHERMRELIRHQQNERRELRNHQRQPHPGLSKKALRRHYKAERKALKAHQKAEWEKFKRECRKRGHDDDDD
jgi:hypothetical protein